MLLSYIGIFCRDDRGGWNVTFPDLPGCAADGGSFHEAIEAGRDALDECLDRQEFAPPARTTVQLLNDAQGDKALARELTTAVLHRVVPSAPDGESEPEFLD